MSTNNTRINAFVSCSLRSEDQAFVNFICSILRHYGINPFGTVGKFSASPENPLALMKRSIKAADIVIVCATARYLQTDTHNGTRSYGLPEMIHFESGMAFSIDKPVVLFVQEGTNVGSALPNITQYITLNGTQADFDLKRSLIESLLQSACSIVKKGNGASLLNAVVGGLAIVGGFTVLGSLFGGGETDDED